MLSCYRLKINAGFVYFGKFVCLLYEGSLSYQGGVVFFVCLFFAKLSVAKTSEVCIGAK